MLSRVRAALLHVVRNAVAHGIEPERDRVAAGKPPAGRIDLRAVRRADAVTFVCRDDGRGIDWDAVRRRAVERGLCPPEQAAALDEARLAGLLLGGGLSTARQVNEVSGRGVGLGVVEEVVRELRGRSRSTARPAWAPASSSPSPSPCRPSPPSRSRPAGARSGSRSTR